MKHTKSIEAFKEAQHYIPGGVDSPVRAFGSVGGTPPFIDRGEGGYLYDIDGNRYIDFVQSWGPLILGHCNARVEQAVAAAIGNGLSFGAPTLLETRLAKMVADLLAPIEQLRFVNSGTEAVMSAIRLARGYTRRNDIVKFKGCYHGHSDSLLVQAGSGAATFGSPSSPGVPDNFSRHTLLAEYNDITSVEACFAASSDIACVIIEPIAGNMGLVPADVAFLEALRKVCDRHGALLIFDEVMSGFRASLHGSLAYADVRPDLVTLGKVIGGGMPVGAFGGAKTIMDALSPNGPVYQAGTLSGNPVAMAAGLATLGQLIENPSIYQTLQARSERLTRGLAEAAKSHGIALQTDFRGSMFGFFFNENPVKNFADAQKSDAQRFAQFHAAMLDRGIYLACSQYETGFISSETTDAMVDETVRNAHEVFGAL